MVNAAAVSKATPATATALQRRPSRHPQSRSLPCQQPPGSRRSARYAPLAAASSRLGPPPPSALVFALPRFPLIPSPSRPQQKSVRAANFHQSQARGGDAAGISSARAPAPPRPTPPAACPQPAPDLPPACPASSAPLSPSPTAIKGRPRRSVLRRARLSAMLVSREVAPLCNPLCSCRRQVTVLKAAVTPVSDSILKVVETCGVL
ncbi:uncharacterized protein LOC126195170 [Schistocerca nitens]|uniref:uncharacterized protein LOC126195170 n=1 Tax=Schistocerca nitens TaxID=7011 RepID=UPI0021194841|nr:uncharacterized protein LOC126195170 [Schistocerca nitens]